MTSSATARVMLGLALQSVLTQLSGPLLSISGLTSVTASPVYPPHSDTTRRDGRYDDIHDLKRLPQFHTAAARRKPLHGRFIHITDIVSLELSRRMDLLAWLDEYISFWLIDSSLLTRHDRSFPVPLLLRSIQTNFTSPSHPYLQGVTM